MAVPNAVATAIAAILSIPAAVLLIECLAACLPARRARTPTSERDPARAQICVVIPAHDESGGIASVVESIRRQLRSGDRILVVADNCSDDTAAVARVAGAEVVERNDPGARGKGFAIAYALERLAAAPPAAVVLVDADCRVSEGGIERLASLALETNRPMQAEYLLVAPAQPSPRLALGAFAFLLRNGVRPRGLHRLGLPCHLTGSGMAFPWPVIRACPPLGGHLVEDLVMGIELAMLGYPAEVRLDVQVRSALPEDSGSALRQRRRWEHGHLETLLAQAWRLLEQSFAQKRVDLLALALDLSVPPLTLLVLAQATLTVAAGALFLAAGFHYPLVIAVTGAACTGVALGCAWFSFGRGVVSARQLLRVPLYVLWKIPLYVSYVLRRKQRAWERTSRDDERSRP